MKKNRISRWIRGVLLASLLVWITYESVMHQLLGGGKSPSIHALCPYGALESLYALLMTGTYIQKIYSGTLIILGVTLLIALLFRRSFCGLLCPFGALQELFARIGKKLFRRRPTVPARADRYLRLLKYGILFLTAFMAWRLGRLWMSSYDPYAAYGHVTAIPGTLAEDPWSIIGFVLLAISLIGSLVYDRFFCKYLCPAGAFYALVGKLSPTRIERQDSVCIHCNLCTKACPVNLDVAKMDQVKSLECLNCNECVTACPKRGALEIRTFKKAVSPLVMIALVACLFFIPIFATQAAGVFEVLPEALKKNETIAVADIKGYMSIADAAIATGLTEDQLRSALKVPASVPSSTLMKNISSLVPGYDFDAAKEAAGAILNPGVSSAGTAGTTAGQASAAAASATAATSVAAAPGKADASLVKGSQTIADAATAVGLSQKEFYQWFRIPESVSASTRMKDIANVVPGYDFDAIKTGLK